MFVRAIKKIEKAMFPILRLDNASQSKVEIKIGTGFFINSVGYFVSAAHLFDGSTTETKHIYSGLLPTDLQNPPLAIQEIVRDNLNDIFIGKINKRTPNFLYLSNKTVDVGRSICIGGYPLAEISVNQNGGLELGKVRRYFQPSFVLERSKVSVKNSDGINRIHDGFLVRDFGMFGMSGGPVFDPTGTVVGVQGSVTQPRVSTSGPRSITVENAAAIRSDLVSSLLKANNIRLN